MTFHWTWLIQIVDILIVFLVTYRVLVWAKGTHSGPLIRGILSIVVIYGISQFLHLTTLNWILAKLATVLILITIIIFQPELRRFLERVGSGSLFHSVLNTQSKDGYNTTLIKQLLKAVELLSREKIGALIVIEVGTSLSEYIQSGIPVNGTISGDLLSTLFWPKSPTHDGAVIIRGDHIEAAGCLLPLTDTLLTDRRLGTRHRAAIGVSQLTDALVIVVSEESGVISLAEGGNLTRYLTREALETRLFNMYRETGESFEV